MTAAPVRGGSPCRVPPQSTSSFKEQSSPPRPDPDAGHRTLAQPRTREGGWQTIPLFPGPGSSQKTRRRSPGAHQLALWVLVWSSFVFPPISFRPQLTSLRLEQGPAASSHSRVRPPQLAVRLGKVALPEGTAPGNTGRDPPRPPSTSRRPLQLRVAQDRPNTSIGGGVPGVDAPPQSLARQSLQAGNSSPARRRSGQSPKEHESPSAAILGRSGAPPIRASPGASWVRERG
ncbi:hypothetical protein NDU88_008238 [Pleurodeles waltl]|uniref:Uncharacterized protein n=1 Tax=Pleurodeles waltl TaxID=8319 RepID=A0AAV7N4F3_PLEWA|nr:hypothetical protein NDU88_008238 [Pleurodeles waltl]